MCKDSSAWPYITVLTSVLSHLMRERLIATQTGVTVLGASLVTVPLEAKRPELGDRTWTTVLIFVFNRPVNHPGDGRSVGARHADGTCLVRALLLYCPTQRSAFAALEEVVLHLMDSALVGEHRGRIRTRCRYDQGAACPT